MQPRRPLGHGFALLAAALLLCVPVLSSCGFNKATDKPYTQANGTNHREGPVFVLNAVVVAAQSDSGTLIASFTNQSETRTETVDQVAGADGNTVTVADFAPISIAPMGLVNLADDDTTSVTLSGNFAAGDVIPLSMTLGDGSVIDMAVPVIYACQEYAGLDVSQTSAGAGDSTSASPTTAPTASATPTETATTTDGATPSPSDTAAQTPSVSPSTYTCGTTGGTGGEN